MFLSQIIPIIRVPIWHNIPTFGHYMSTRLLTNPKSWVYTIFGKEIPKATLMIMNTCDLWLWQVKNSITSSKQQRKNCDWNCLDVSVTSVTWLPHSGTGTSDPQHKASPVHWLVVLVISTRTMSLRIIIPNMEEAKKTTKQSNVVKGIFGFVPFPIGLRAPASSRTCLSTPWSFSPQPSKKNKEIINPAAWSPPEASTSEELSSTKADGTSKDWRARSTEAEIIFRTGSKMLSFIQALHPKVSHLSELIWGSNMNIP